MDRADIERGRKVILASFLGVIPKVVEGMKGYGESQRDRLSQDLEDLYCELANCHLYISTSDVVGLFSYAKEKENPFDARIRAKPFRVMARCAEDNFSNIPEQVIKNIITYILPKVYVTVLEVEVVTGVAIAEAYRTAYAWDSCLTGSNLHTQDTLEIFVMNPDKVELCKFLSQDSGDKARALLWTTDTGERVLDRLYPNDSNLMPLIEDWCVANKIIQRANNWLAEASDSIYLKDKKYYEVTLSVASHNVETTFPYLDTFAYAEWDDMNQYVALIKDASYKRWGRATIDRILFKVTLTNQYKDRCCFLTTQGWPMCPSEYYHSNEYDNQPTADVRWEVATPGTYGGPMPQPRGLTLGPLASVLEGEF